jgi:hypothetical protein
MRSSMDFVGERDRLETAHAKRGEDAMPACWEAKNKTSIDGLPGIDGNPKVAIESTT